MGIIMTRFAAMRGVSVAAACCLWLMPAAAQTPAAYRGARTADGKPNLNGIWQVFGTAAWDLEARSPHEGVPAGESVVEGGAIPYQPWAAAKKKENYAKRLTADPMSKCFVPGVPRVTYVPLPFEIVQTPKYVVMMHEYAHTQIGRAHV